MSAVFLNGQWCAIEDAKISVLDRGFIFGDGVYEVIPVYQRRPYRMVPHLNRLQYSLDGIYLTNPYSMTDWESHVEQLIERHEFEDQAIYIQVTRGVALRAHDFPEVTAPTVFMMSNPLVSPPYKQIEQGVQAVSMEDKRWLHCDYKTTSLLGNVLASQYAKDHQAITAVQFRNGFLTEGAACNIVVVKDSHILLPEKNHLILHGITLLAVVELAEQMGVSVKWGKITEAQVRSADELWLTSSTKNVLPITRLDDQSVGVGGPGPLFKRMYLALKQDIERSCKGII